MRIIFSLFIFCFANGYCQTDTITVINAQRTIQPSEKRYLQYTETKEGFILFNSILTRKTEKISYGDSSCWLITQTYQTSKAIDTDSSLCAYTTLRPVTYHTRIQSDGYTERVNFSTSISNEIQYKDSIGLHTYPNHNYYNGVISNDLIMTLPLHDGKSFVFKLVNPGRHFTEYVHTIKVAGTEKIAIGGMGDIECWKLEVNDGGSNTTEWYSKKDRQLVKKMYRFKNGNIFHRILIAG